MVNTFGAEHISRGYRVDSGQVAWGLFLVKSLPNPGEDRIGAAQAAGRVDSNDCSVGDPNLRLHELSLSYSCVPSRKVTN